MANEQLPTIGGGYGRSVRKTYSIGSGSASAAAGVDFGRAYAFYAIECENASGIASGSTMSLRAGGVPGAVMLDVWGAAGKWASPALPTGGTFRLLVDEVGFAQVVQPILSAACTSGFNLYLYGYDNGAQL